LSTRVHELAKELGMKSQELLERIQKGGLDVKPSPLASLDAAMVARIKELVQGPAVAPAPAPPAQPTPPPRPPETPAIAPSAAAPSAPLAGPAPGAAAQGPKPPAPPVAATPTPSAAPSRPAPTPGDLRAAPTPAAPAPRPAAPGPLAGHGRGGAGGPAPVHRSGAGPLSGHTPHRGPAAGTTAGPAAARPESPPAGETRAPAPIRPSDYIGPAGTRPTFPQAPRPGSGPPPVRRAGQRPAPGTEAPRREPLPQSGPRRPLPPIAAPAPAGPALRRPETGPRPGEPGSKTQRPDQKYTPEQIRALMQSGQIGGPGATPLAPPRGAAAGRPGPSPAGAGLRRPPGPGGPVAPPAIGPAPPMGESDEEERRGKGGAGRPGGSADRAGRRAKRAERATERSRVTSPVDARTLIEGEDDGRRVREPRRHKAVRGALIAPRKTHAQLEPPVTVRGLSEAIGIKANDLIRKLMSMGQLVTINTTLEDETAIMLAMEFGVEVEVVYPETAIDEVQRLIEGAEGEQAQEGLVPRPPVITILGHVDHGKTSLLDKIRSANVVATESGGITQHIGAYQVEHDGKKLTFVDTPGHEAFTAMRARGANVTDIVVLVVAADDGVMPQTQEAIAHAKAAEVPVVVALNKIDLPNVDNPANINKIYGELSQQGLIPEEYGGDVPVVKTSATTGKGIDDLLATLEVVAELHDLKANPDRAATGTCLEASLSEGRGVVATVLVQDGTLKVGDVMVCGDGYGRVRALFDDKGRSIPAAGPSTPVEVSGLDEVPTAGEKFAVIDDITRAREAAEARRSRARGAALGERQAITLENLFSRMAEQKVKNLNLILKADVQGSLEALTKELEKIQNQEVPVRVLHKAVGAITESDVLLADASQAIIIGFRVAPEDRAVSLAEEKKIDIRRYDIIYQVTDEIKKAVEGMLVPETKEVYLGKANVRQVFKISKVGAVAGCFVTQGTIERGAKARVFRDGREIYKGTIEALKRFKEDVKEVRENFECGIKIANFDDIKTDDTIEAYRIDVIRRTL
jgi:translation initiation factor IF-2